MAGLFDGESWSNTQNHLTRCEIKSKYQNREWTLIMEGILDLYKVISKWQPAFAIPKFESVGHVASLDKPNQNASHLNK